MVIAMSVRWNVEQKGFCGFALSRLGVVMEKWELAHVFSNLFQSSKEWVTDLESVRKYLSAIRYLCEETLNEA